jgi:hypothetical protein
MPPPYVGSQPDAKRHWDHSCDDSPGIDIVILRLSEEPHATITAGPLQIHRLRSLRLRYG